MTQLHIIYRSYGPENRKARPPFYSKRLALLSLLRAAEQCGKNVELLFLNDGPIPEDRLVWMRRFGEVVEHERLGFRGSYHTALALPLERGWPSDDLVWFSEDDYLYRSNALSNLRAAADLLHEASYFGLYASFGTHGSGAPVDGMKWSDEHWIPPGWCEFATQSIQAQSWQRGLTTTWTFGARVGALRDDQQILRLSDYTGLAGCDRAMCLTYQGLRPFRWDGLARDMTGLGAGNARDRAKHWLVAPLKAAMNLWARSRARRPHFLWAADPALATHMEADHLALGTDWSSVASECHAWAANRVERAENPTLLTAEP